ncbi:hypothetical protein DTO169C6_9112 [Paecilomyces variotii]|nr:hypothetical protein DTO169C6_9112 [Paecilomyces variotii]KAJ9258760.1 hypothetical protein DTO195F2_5145 [Paecilomyces variotii]KAJ9357418.1 hypothetical protein DTO027B9_3121 [Paecilomyces variotii]KAJ9379802.1 hypothetical protein DTO063F5_6958 [Paecilomyces variotii]KAJ9407958.1 hypothetical protein DTO045G8_4425 [Paecilomyces variotii]
MVGYKTTKPHEYLVITGAGIDGVRVCKKAFVKPWQKASRISLLPCNVPYSDRPRTIEKHVFNLDVVFTVGPDDNPESVKRCAQILSRNECRLLADEICGRSSTIRNIVKGEVNATVARMTMEEIFKEREIFKDEVMGNIQKELEKFGLRVHNANILDISDSYGSFDYLTCMSKKVQEAAVNQSRIDSAEAQMRGQIGEAKIDGLKRQETSRIKTETVTIEAGHQKTRAEVEAELSRLKAELDNNLELAKLTARRQYDMTDAELQRQVEVRKTEKELERLRASDVVKSKIARESAQEKADAFLYKEQKEADAALYKRKLEADALCYQQKREAEAMLEMAKAHSALVDVLGGPQGFLQYKMLESGTYERLAEANGNAISGLQPKITMWNTGNGDASDNPIRGLMQSLPPLLSTIHDQTGISPPSWLARMPNKSGQEEKESQDIIPKAMLFD